MPKYEVRLQNIGENKWQVLVIPPTGYEHRGYIHLGTIPRCEAIVQGRAVARQKHTRLQIDE